MINYHEVIGREESFFHDLDIYTNGMSLVITPGKVISNNQTLITNEEETTISFETSDRDKHVDIFVDNGNLNVVEYSNGEYHDAQGEKLIFFTIPANTTDLSNVEINFIKIVKDDLINFIKEVSES